MKPSRSTRRATIEAAAGDHMSGMIQASSPVLTRRTWNTAESGTTIPK